MVEANDRVMSSSWVLVHEARGLLWIYQDITIKKVDHLSNEVAHVLAQLGKAGVSRVMRDSECVQDLIINNVNITWLNNKFQTHFFSYQDWKVFNEADCLLIYGSFHFQKKNILYILIFFYPMD
jgi:hypothetical protein